MSGAQNILALRGPIPRWWGAPTPDMASSSDWSGAEPAKRSVQTPHTLSVTRTPGGVLTPGGPHDARRRRRGTGSMTPGTPVIRDQLGLNEARRHGRVQHGGATG